MPFDHTMPNAPQVLGPVPNKQTPTGLAWSAQLDYIILQNTWIIYLLKLLCDAELPKGY